VGTIVTDINMKTFKDIYDLRMLLAESMGELSPNPVTGKHIEAMSKLIERSEKLRHNRDIEKYAGIANDLEEVLIDLIGSAPLREVTDNLYYRVARIWFTFLPNLNWEEVVNAQLLELKRMRDAMKKSDIRAVGQIRSHYLRGILDGISGYISGG
jgi:DNA-binding GntR family transcriptional regulator